MKCLICGSRDITNYQILLDAIKNSKFDITCIIEGGARGVDSLGGRFARENNIDLEIVFPEWDKLGKKAGYVRNAIMCEKCDIAIIIWDGLSKGTKHSLDLIKKLDKPYYLTII